MLAGSISGLSGFGYALVSVPLLLAVYDPTTVIVVLAFIGIFTSALVALDSFQMVKKRTIASLLLPSALGLLVGVELLRRAEAVYIELAAGSLVMMFSVILIRGWALPGLEGSWGPVVAGTLAGTMSTSIGLGGPPIVMLFAARKLTRDAFRATNAAYFTISSSLTLTLLLLRGMVEWEHFRIAALLIPAVFMGKLLGTLIAGRLPDSNFRTVTLGITLVAGCFGVLSAGWELLSC